MSDFSNTVNDLTDKIMDAIGQQAESSSFGGKEIGAACMFAMMKAAGTLAVIHNMPADDIEASWRNLINHGYSTVNNALNNNPDFMTELYNDIQQALESDHE